MEMEESSYRWRETCEVAMAKLAELNSAREQRHQEEAALLRNKKWFLSRWWIRKKSAWHDALDKEEEEELQYMMNPFSAFRKP